MIKVVVLYEQAPDADAYAAHAEVCRQVPGGTFRHGKAIGSPHGDPAHVYLAEWEFPDRESFEAATRSEEFAATGKDARDRGLPRPVVGFFELD
jgi:uncharacterized protein (TIGR02118 family)